MKALAPLVLALTLLTATVPAAAQEDPALDQTIPAGEPVAAGPAELATGHVDLGPRLVDGVWRLLVRDDGVVPSVWRDLDETVLRVGDGAIRPIPDDPTYGFLGAPVGADVFVVPQIQAADVVWLGWNTQDPEVMASIDRGVTLTLRGVQGPGQLTVYLQSGNLTEPEVLWTSADRAAQPLWVDVNTHTHANWVFTRPGAYLVVVEASAELVTGETVIDTQLLRFAVGSATDAADARAAQLTGPIASDPAPGSAADEAPSTDDGGASIPVVPLTAGAAALTVVGGLAVLRSGRARRQALAGRDHERT